MDFKHWLVAAATVILPKHSSAENRPTHPDSIKKPKTEVVTNKQPENTITTDSVSLDSLLYEKRLNLLRESRKDMLLLIAHFENVKARAYWDKVAKKFSIGLGFTQKKDGSNVTAHTVIRTEDELMDYWERYTEDKMFPTMAKYLLIEESDHQQRVALGSIAFNCGAGIYRQYIPQTKEYEPSRFAETLNTFFKTKDSIYLNKSVFTFEQYIKSRGRVINALEKRRRIEGDIFAHKIMLINRDTIANIDSTNTNGDVSLPENSIDLNQTIIGASYSIGNLPEDSTELATKIREYDKNGYNYADSITRAFSAPAIIPVKRRTKKPLPKPHPRGRAR